MAIKNNFRTTIIISIYKDINALDIILASLKSQTFKNFDILISEDDDSTEVKKYIESIKPDFPSLLHLSQNDNGFQKNRALNRAIVSSKTEHLIFIDGDCIPHSHFIEAHRKYASAHTVCAGRRVELGKSLSSKIRSGSVKPVMYNSNIKYLASIFLQLYDKCKNFEYGFYFPGLQKLSLNRPINLLGSNFSCFKADLIAINGFNEDYKSPGIGEDSDIDWRLRKNGVSVKNVKFIAIQYHLNHPRAYTVSDKNKDILKSTKENNIYITQHGISQHAEK